VPRVHLLLDPLGELFLDDGGADVRDPLLGSLRELDVRLWQICVDFRVLLVKELPDLLDAESFVSVEGKKLLEFVRLIKQSHLLELM
jgi:hypothetical protein